MCNFWINNERILCSILILFGSGVAGAAPDSNIVANALSRCPSFFSQKESDKMAIVSIYNSINKLNNTVIRTGVREYILGKKSKSKIWPYSKGVEAYTKVDMLIGYLFAIPNDKRWRKTPDGRMEIDQVIFLYANGYPPALRDFDVAISRFKRRNN